MLTKVNNVLMAAAPADGEASGSGAPAESGTEAPATQDGAGSEAAPEEESSSLNDTGEGSEDDFGADFDLDAFLHYDPMSVSKTLKGEEADDEDDGKKEPATKVPEGKDPTKPAEAKEAKEPGQQEKENPEMKLLREQVQSLTQMLNQQQQVANTATQEAPPKSEQTPEQQHQDLLKSLPNYQFKIPADVMEKFSSEDASKVQQGLSEYATGIAQVTHYNVLAQMRQEMAKLREEVLNQSVERVKTETKAENEAAEQRSAVSKDFYGKFPELDKPELKLFIQMQAKQLAQQYGVAGWNESFRDTLGAHVKKVLGLKDQGPPPSDQESQKKSQTRFNSGSGAGRTKPNTNTSEADDIASTLLG